MSFFHSLLVLLLLLQACGKAGEESSGDESSNTDSVRMETPQNDSTPVPEPAGPGLAPGQAKVRVEVTEIDSSEEGATATVEVRSVLEYGSSTTPIPTGKSLTLQLRDQAFRQAIESDKKATLLLQQNVSKESSQSGWSLVNVIN